MEVLWGGGGGGVQFSKGKYINDFFKGGGGIQTQKCSLGGARAWLDGSMGF